MPIRHFLTRQNGRHGLLHIIDPLRQWVIALMSAPVTEHNMEVRYAQQLGLYIGRWNHLAHFSVSSTMSLAKSAGEPGSCKPPRSASQAFIFESAGTSRRLRRRPPLYWPVEEAVAEAADGEVAVEVAAAAGATTAASITTVRVEVAVRPVVSVATY